MQHYFLTKTCGGNMVKILAVSFDVVTALQRALNTACVMGMSNEHVQSMPHAVITFSADGGNVRRKEITAYTECVSTPCRQQELTDLTPILYAFSGKKLVERDIAIWVKTQLAAVSSNTFTFSVLGATWRYRRHGGVVRAALAVPPWRLAPPFPCGFLDMGWVAQPDEPPVERPLGC